MLVELYSCRLPRATGAGRSLRTIETVAAAIGRATVPAVTKKGTVMQKLTAADPIAGRTARAGDALANCLHMLVIATIDGSPLAELPAIAS